MDLQGSIVDKIYSCAHVELDEQGRVEMVVENILEILSRNRLGEGDLGGNRRVGCAGHIRFREGIILTTSNLSGFKNYPLRDRLQSHFTIPVVLDNDANAQAWGGVQIRGRKRWRRYGFHHHQYRASGRESF